jgi:hypothetical protein
MPKGIRDFIKTTEKTTFIQGRVPVSLYERVRVLLERDGISWGKFIRASCSRFLAESESKHERAKKS